MVSVKTQISFSDISENNRTFTDRREHDILIEVLASIAEQERVRTLQRQAQGIAAAKEKGKHLGRPKADYPENWDDVYGRWKRGEITAKNAMAQLGLKRSTFYKLVGTVNDI